MGFQKGILEAPPAHATVLTFDLTDAQEAPNALAEVWEDIDERLEDWYAWAALTVTIGFGLPLFERLGKMDRKPNALCLMPGWEGDDFDPAQTQADVIVQICSNDRAANHHVERSILKQVASAFRLKDYHYGFSMHESRGVLGFVDGTGNPKGDARLPAVFIGDEDQAYSGGAYLVLRKIREDLDRWESLGVDVQERVVGRRKADSAKLSGGAYANSHKEKSSVETDAGEIEILRRSFPFSSPEEAGLLFICFVRDVQQYETVKDQMVSTTTDGVHTGKDAIEEYYTSVSGGYYFVPPRSDDGYLGDFLFE